MQRRIANQRFGPSQIICFFGILVNKIGPICVSN